MSFVGDAAPYVSAGLEFIGGIAANQASAKSVDKQLAFQERMSSTAYQRATRDMEAAGLNPALAYQQGGASSPGGASYDAENVGAAGSRGFAAGTSAKAVMQQTAADVELKRAAADKTAAEANQIKLESALRVQDLQANVTATQAQGRLTDRTALLREIEMNRAKETFEADVEAGRMQPRMMAQRMEETRARIGLMSQAQLESSVRTHLGELAIPQAGNKAAAESTWWKKYVAPFLSDAQGVARMASPFAGGF